MSTAPTNGVNPSGHTLHLWMRAHTGGTGYAAIVIDGNDLHILSRSGDERPANAHDGNMITFHTVRNFRDSFISGVYQRLISPLSGVFHV